ncbi:SAM-dependent methyltransferase [Streptomyces cyaneofuscatus]|uniref:S-adenosyl-L-methionine-dependent methyltransferase n=1 Tax=Streptomyces cyaneofuscatus TaxID=66883 RepID=A0ABZ1EWP1_9ACTN|nr:SAM-dependent methyltransferase [Streptomyces cyaneofuscatus]WSB08540.1 SAM-dependent methyltransferase [Streptomyces cyaneofuscatus]WSD47927.1 SAM-dependent methyltransferase [Streptomyces cyaneofuscatus]
MDAVSYTAQWMAAARAQESEREDPLFVDPLARDLAAPRGFELVERYAGGGVLPFISIRTRFLDDAIEEIVASSGIQQVVLVAAGMDTRAFRLDWPDGTELYEVDHAPLIAEKRRRLDALGAEPSTDRREVSADLTTAWLPALEAAGFDRARPTLWVAEGLTFFLTEDQVGGLLRLLASASAPGSHLAFDLLGRAMLRSPFSKRFLDALAADGTPWLFGTDEPEEFLTAQGWKTTDLREPGQPGAGEGRWPYEVQPRGRHGANRLWLIRAEVVTD